jgi:hypothetical protein
MIKYIVTLYLLLFGSHAISQNYVEKNPRPKRIIDMRLDEKISAIGTIPSTQRDAVLRQDDNAPDYSTPFACPTANTKKVSVFIQLNPAYVEIEAAAKAACTRGETLILVPKMSLQEAKKLSKLYYGKRKIQDKIYECRDLACQDRIRNKFKKVEQEYKELHTKIVPKRMITAKEIEILLKKEIMDKDLDLTAFTLSGHHTSSYYGEFGNIEDHNLMNMFKNLKKEEPFFFNNMHSFNSFGCYTTTSNWIDFINKTFTQVPFIYAGYQGSGAAGDKIAAHNYLASLFKDYDKLIHAQTKQDLCKKISELDSFRYLNAGVYVSGCNQSMVSTKNYHLNESGKMVTDSKCATVEEVLTCPKDTLKKILETFKFFKEGRFRIPTDTQNGNLRSLYSQVKQHIACFKANEIKPDDVLLMLFFKNVKTNFQNIHKDLINEVIQNITNNLPTVTESDSSNQMSQYNDPNNRSQRVQKVIRNYLRKGFNSLPRRDIVRLSQYMGELTSLSQDSNQFVEMRKLQKLTNQYLVNLDSSCMNPVVWHESEENVTVEELSKPENSSCHL